MKEFPESDMQLTHIIVVKEMKRSLNFYTHILGASLYREYGGTSSVLDFNGSWLLLVTEGGPTADKPEITFTPLPDRKQISQAYTIRVKDCQNSYEILKSRGADFITPPYDRGMEIRCFFHDPDGYLWEISEYKQ